MPEQELLLSVYRHTDAIQCLAFNPVSHHLLSCSISELGKKWQTVHIDQSA